jgi:dTDP-4-amino-4,6-dideoxygalactose transaminase
LDTIQAAILQAKLSHLQKWNEQRRTNARLYDALLQSQADDIILPYESPRTRSVYHLYVIRVKHRNELQANLAKADIATQVHYPTPLHLQGPYMALGYRAGDFPVTETAVAEILSLPMYPQLNAWQQRRVVQEVIRLHSGKAVDERKLNLEPPATAEGCAA